jgi:putative Mg2+ transporter-C (MgtC) family protein
VCVTSCAVALLAGYPALWYWGNAHETSSGDPTRVIGAVLTGIGFLGAGIIVQSGTNVRGLTTAASIWGTSAIGILIGIGFYLPAIGLTALFVVSTAVVPRIEHRLPAHSALAASLRFREGYRPQPEKIHQLMVERGFSIPSDSISVVFGGGKFELRCLILISSVARATAMNRIVEDLREVAEVESFTVEHSSRA